MLVLLLAPFLHQIFHMKRIPRGLPIFSLLITASPAFAQSNVVYAKVGHCLLQNIQTHWDDVQLVYGYPGKSAVIARKTGEK